MSAVLLPNEVRCVSEGTGGTGYALAEGERWRFTLIAHECSEFGELDRCIAVLEAEAEDNIPWLDDAAEEPLKPDTSFRSLEYDELFLIILGMSDPDELVDIPVDVPGRDVDDEVSLRVREARSKSAG